MNRKNRQLEADLKQKEEQLAKLKSIKVTERSYDDKLKIAELNASIAKAKFKLLGEKTAEAKDKAMLKILHANAVDTENQVKDLLRIRSILKAHGINTIKELREHLGEAKD